VPPSAENRWNFTKQVWFLQISPHSLQIYYRHKSTECKRKTSTSSACPEAQINGGHRFHCPHSHMLCLNFFFNIMQSVLKKLLHCKFHSTNNFTARAPSFKPYFKMQFWSLKSDSGFKCQSVVKLSDGCSWSCVAFLSVAGIKQSSVLAFAT